MSRQPLHLEPKRWSVVLTADRWTDMATSASGPSHGAVEGQSGFAAIPRDEPVDGECVAPTRMNRGKGIEHGRLRLFQFRYGERLGANFRSSMLLRIHADGSFQPPPQFSPQ